MEKAKKLICLDLDNTIIRSDKAHIIAYNKAFKKNGLPKVKEALLKKKFGRVGKIILKELFPALKDREINKLIKDHNYFLIKETKKYATIIPGAKAALKKLKKKYRIALVTNCSTITLTALLKGAGIDKKIFDIIIGYDKVLHPKPCPDEIIKAEKLLHLRATYMVGDTIYDILAGKKAKVKVIAVLTGNHTKAMLKKKKPYKIIKSIKDLPKIV